VKAEFRQFIEVMLCKNTVAECNVLGGSSFAASPVVPATTSAVALFEI
jgi:hypothetical protein